MPACAVCGKGKPEILCLGCGNKVCADCVIEARGVKYCKNCQEVAKELEKTLSSPSFTPGEDTSDRKISKYNVHDSSADSKWEKTFDSSTMVEVKHSDLHEARGKIDLRECYAGIGRRAIGHLLDWAFAGVLSFVLTLLVLQLLAADVSVLMDTLSMSASDAPVLVSAVCFLLSLFFMRLILNSFGGVTLGRLFAGTKLVSAEGLPAGFGRGFVHALASTVLDLFVLIGWILYFVTFNKQGQSIHDRIAGTCVVMGTVYKKAAVNAIMGRSKDKLGVAQPKSAAPEASPQPSDAEDDLFAEVGEEEIQSPFATYDEYIPEESAEEESEGDSEEENSDHGEEWRKGENSDVSDPWDS